MSSIESTRTGAAPEAGAADHETEPRATTGARRTTVSASPSTPAPPPPSANTEDHSLFSLQPILRWLRYVGASVKRSWPTAIIVFVASTLLGGMFLASSPATYESSATILLAGDQTLGGSAGGTLTASRQANQVIRRTESLDRMINELQLIENKPVEPIFGAIAERVSGWLGTPTRQQEVTAMQADLRNALLVFNNDSEASIQVFIQWPDPEQAAGIARIAYDVFLEERTEVEVGPLEQSVGILAERALRASSVVNDLRNELDLSPGDGAPAGSLLEGAVRNEQDLLAQLRVVEVELEQAEVSMRSRYALLAEPEVPSAPVSGNLVNYLATLIFAAVMTGGVCFLLTRPRGKIVAPWQMERFDVPVFVTVPYEVT